MEGREVIRCSRCYEWVASPLPHGVWCNDCFYWTLVGIMRDYREVMDRLAKT